MGDRTAEDHNRVTPPNTASPFDRSRAQALKSEAMLDTASILLNEKGPTGMSVNELSRRLGVSKRTVYNYFGTKDDLIYQCYERTIRISADILDEVSARPGPALDRIHTYLRTQIDDAQPPFAVVNAVRSLPAERAAALRHEGRRCRKQLCRLLRDGIADGSVAPCHPELTAMVIFSILSWVPMWFSRSGSLTLAEVARTFERLLTHGLRPGTVDAPRDDIPVGPRLQPVRTDLAGLKKDALLRAATTLFNRDGVVETSIDDVVEDLDVTKGAVYYYFDNKEQLLGECYERSLDLAERMLDLVEAASASPLERVRLYLDCYVTTHAGLLGPMMIFTGLDNLSTRRRRAIVERGRALERRTERWIRDGVADGLVRDVNPLLVRFAIVGALDSLPKWYRASGAGTPTEIAACFNHLFSEGLAPRAG